MSQFIEPSDYDASVHRDILEALTRQDNAILEILEDRSISEMRGYLGKRYDVDTIFSKRGADRHSLVLMFCLDISIYHAFCIHNPMKLSQMRKDRYDRAIEWLKQVGHPTNPLPVDGLELKPAAEVAKQIPFLYSSRPKRDNHY